MKKRNEPPEAAEPLKRFDGAEGVKDWPLPYLRPTPELERRLDLVFGRITETVEAVQVARQGRPSARQFVEDVFRSRVANKKIAETLAAEARYLASWWLQKKDEGDPPLGSSRIEKIIKDRFWDAKGGKPRRAQTREKK